MKEYKDCFTEEVSRAALYRRNYLESVVSLAEQTKKSREGERERYIDPEGLKSNRDKYLADFKSLLGDPMFDRKKQRDVQRIFVGMDGQGYIYRLVFTFEKGIRFCGLLFVPFDAKGKLPLVTAVHGGDGTPELMADMYGVNYYSHIVKRLLDKKVIVFAPQLLIWDGKVFGDRFDRFELDAKYKALGGSLTAFECECIMGALDSLLDNDIIDGSRVGIAGLSYGGYYSLMTAILDERIKSVYSSGVFNDRLKYPRQDFTYFGMAEKMLDAECAALIAPRSLYLEAGKNDGIFKYEGAVAEFERLKNYYDVIGGRLVFKLTDEGHKFDSTDDGIDFLIDNL